MEELVPPRVRVAARRSGRQRGVKGRSPWERSDLPNQLNQPAGYELADPALMFFLELIKAVANPRPSNDVLGITRFGLDFLTQTGDVHAQ